MEKYNKLIAPNPLFEMVHVSMDEEVEDATKWAVEASLPWLTILPEAKADGVMTLYPEEGVPEYLLVDASGKVISTSSSDEDEDDEEDDSAKVFKKIAELAAGAK